MEAENGRAALQRLAERTPTLIILDLMMPEMDGFDFILELRKTPAWRSIPVVVLTAKDVTEDDRRRLNGSVAKILRKAAYRREELLLEVREQVKACLRSAGRRAPKSRPWQESLVIEDNEMNRDMLSRRLERKGYHVIMATDGRHGISAARTRRPI